MFLQTWSSEMENTTRGRSYSLYSIFKFQPYLNVVNISKFRIALTRFRVSAHRLEVESGRWHKPEKILFENRKCKHCNVLEDEFHFLLECPLFTHLRKKYIHKYYRKNTNMIKFIELLQTDNEKRVRNLSIFVFKAFKLRADLYYQ
jgi:hypothetical protein